MQHHSVTCVFLLALYCCGCVMGESASVEKTQEIRELMKSVLKVFFGGDDRPCHYRCSDGSNPMSCPEYEYSPPKGCGSPLFGFQFDVGIPSVTKCCNQHDRCYDTCGQEKQDCDEQFKDCLKTICTNMKITLGLDESVEVCESAVNLLSDAVTCLGCQPYLDSQRKACACGNEEL